MRSCINLFSAIFVYVYNDTPCRNWSSIITVNREKCQIIKKSMLADPSSSQIVKPETTGNSIKWWERYTAVTKPAVWVQFTVKKNRVDDKNLLHLKYLTCQKLQLFFLYLERFHFRDCFVLSLNLDQYAAHLNSVHIMTKVIILNKKNLEKIWKLI